MMSWPEAQPTFIDGDLTLRPWQLSDAERVFHICQDPKVQEYTTVPVPYRREDATAFIERNTPAGPEAGYAYACVVNGEVVGSASLHNLNNFDHVVELGYWVSPEARGNRIATRASKMLVAFAFSSGARRVQAFTLPENEGSRRTLLAAGFEFETLLRNGLTRRDGTQTDAVVFAIFPPVSVS